MPYAIMARGSLWVTPSLLCNKWPYPYPVSCTISVAQAVAVECKLRATRPLIPDSP